MVTQASKQHRHYCPECKEYWNCASDCPIWDQEDTLCSWFVDLTCPDCFLNYTQEMKEESE